ncbi:MAG: TolC family protein, partial [Calditrichales bacterium]
KVLSSSIHRLEDQLNRVRDLYLSAQATPFDTLDISNRRLMLRNQREILSDAYAIQMARMRYLLNEEAIPEPIEPSTESADFSVDDLDYYIDVALNTRPELKNVTAVKRGQTFYSEALQARFYPQVSASLAFNYLKPTGDLFKNEWTNFYSIFVNFQWELWNWKRDARKVQQVRLDIERLDIQELQMFKDIRHQVEVAWRTCQSTRKMIQLQEALVAQEKEQFRITGQRYNQGLSTMIDLNAAESSLTEVEIELHKHYIDWFRNKLQLAFAIGTLGQDLEEVMNEN